MSRRERIISEISDSVIRLMYYDRKEDEELPRGAIDEAICTGEITISEMATVFAAELESLWRRQP